MSLKQAARAASTWIVLATTLLAVLLVLYAWRLPPFHTAIETTENAYVRGSVTVIAPKVDGYVAAVDVLDYMPVKAGQVLVRLDDRNYRQKLEQARGNLAAQEAERGLRTLVTTLEPALIVAFGGLVAFTAAALLQAVYSLRPGM